MGRPLLEHLVERLRYARHVDGVIIATTTHPRDDELAELGEALGLQVFRGSEEDVLDRYYHAAREAGLREVVRITSDCPLIDPHVVDQVVQHFAEGHFDFVSTNHPATFPDGLDTEVFTFEALERAWRSAAEPHEREHVTPFIWDQPDVFRIGNVEHDVDLSRSERWTLDYPEDFEFIRRVYEALYVEGQCFYMEDILNLLDEHTDIRAINQRHANVNWYAKHWESLNTKDLLSTRSGEESS